MRRRAIIEIPYEELSAFARPSVFSIKEGNLTISIYKGNRYPENYANFNAWLQKHFQFQGELSYDGLSFVEPKSAFIVAVQLLKYQFAQTRINSNFITLVQFAIEKYPKIESEDCSSHLQEIFKIASEQYQIQLSEYFFLSNIARDLGIVLEDINLNQPIDNIFESCQVMILDVENLMRKSSVLHNKIIDGAREYCNAYNEIAFKATTAAKTITILYQREPKLFLKAMHECFKDTLSLAQRFAGMIDTLKGNTIQAEPTFLELAQNTPTHTFSNAEKEFEYESSDGYGYASIITFHNLTPLKEKVSALIKNKEEAQAFIGKFEKFEKYAKEHEEKLMPHLEELEQPQSPLFHKFNSQESPLISVIYSDLDEPVKLQLLQELARTKKYNQEKKNVDICSGPVKYPNIYIKSPLAHAVEVGTLEMVEILLKSGANPNQVNGGLTPLHRAMERGELSIVTLLVARGANIRAETEKKDGGYGRSSGTLKKTPLHFATDGNCAKFLVGKGASLKARDEDENTPLHDAAGRLIHTDGYGRFDTPKCQKEGNRHLELLRAFIDLGAEINPRNKFGYTPLHFSCFFDKENSGGIYFEAAAEKVRLLCEAGANVNVRSNEGAKSRYDSTPKNHFAPFLTPLLMLYVYPNDLGGFDSESKRRNFAKIAEILLFHGAEVDASDLRGETTLHHLAHHHEPIGMEVLLRYKANPNARAGEQGLTPLHELMKWGTSSYSFTKGGNLCLEMLLKAGSDPNICTTEKLALNVNALHYPGASIGEHTMALILKQKNPFSEQANKLEIVVNEKIEEKFLRVWQSLGVPELKIQLNMNPLQYAQDGKREYQGGCSESVAIFNQWLEFGRIARSSVSIFCLSEPWRLLPLEICYQIMSFLSGSNEMTNKVSNWIRVGRTKPPFPINPQTEKEVLIEAPIARSTSQDNIFALFGQGQGSHHESALELDSPRDQFKEFK